MAHFKTIHIGDDKYKVSVNAEGSFYTDVPDHIFQTLPQSCVFHSNSDRKRAISNTFDGLVRDLTIAFHAYNEPEVIEEHIIKYNIESRICFALAADGSIHGNGHIAGEGYKWCDSKYGDHGAENPIKNGYSLTIGAVALTRKTTKWKTGREKVEYARYYKGGSHWDNENPAQLLNQWRNFTYNNGFKEIPYSDNAALFFHEILLGMAKLSVLIQENTFDQEKLLEKINSGIPLLTNG